MKMAKHRRWAISIAVMSVGLMCSVGAFAQDTNLAEDASTAIEDASDGPQTVHINWMKKMSEGGFTMVILAALSVAGLAFAGERFIFLREKYVAPKGFAERVVELIRQKNVDDILKLCEEEPSTLATVTKYIIEHQDMTLQDISANVGDIAGREIRDMTARNNPLSVIAALSPLLGLLGTMIGMIEAFELVSIYGDEGGASMLAGSIAKALITTAAGLIIAIPAIGAYNFFKHRINTLSGKLERDVEKILDEIS
jgi:biopolymer transport protein ExbB